MGGHEEKACEACVVGAGLVGSAAAKYLAQHLDVGRVVLVGPSEGLQESLESFGCHADEGRITRRLDVDAVWAELARRSMARYAQIQAESGIRFHAAVGCLAVGLKGGPYLEAVAATAKRSQVELRELDEGALRAKWPYLRLDATLFEDRGEYAGLYEEGHAGHVSPRKLAAAQLRIFEKLGGTHVEEVVESVTKAGGDVFVLSTSSGRSIRAKRVLVATNASTNFHRLLPRRLKLRLTTQTTVRRRVARLDTMPAVIVKAGATPFGAEDAGLDACYVLPPIEYGQHSYVKIGHGTHFENDLASKRDVLRWYRGETPDADADRDLAALLQRLFVVSGGEETSSPLVAAPDDDTTVVRCVIPKTPTKRPYLHSFGGALACCVGCNGYAAKSSDELGRLAASMLLPDIVEEDQRPWGGDIPPGAFRAVFDDDDDDDDDA